MLLYRNAYQKMLMPDKYPTVWLDKPKQSPAYPKPPITWKSRKLLGKPATKDHKGGTMKTLPA